MTEKRSTARNVSRNWVKASRRVFPTSLLRPPRSHRHDGVQFVFQRAEVGVVAVPQVGGLFSPGFDEGQHEVDCPGRVTGRPLVLDNDCASVADADLTTTERVWIDGIGDQAVVFLDGVAAGRQTRVEKSTVGSVRAIQVPDEGHETFAVKRLETCLHVSPALAFRRLCHDIYLSNAIFHRLRGSRNAHASDGPGISSESGCATSES